MALIEEPITCKLPDDWLIELDHEGRPLFSSINLERTQRTDPCWAPRASGLPVTRMYTREDFGLLPLGWFTMILPQGQVLYANRNGKPASLVDPREELWDAGPLAMTSMSEQSAAVVAPVPAAVAANTTSSRPGQQFAAVVAPVPAAVAANTASHRPDQQSATLTRSIWTPARRDMGPGGPSFKSVPAPAHSRAAYQTRREIRQPGVERSTPVTRQEGMTAWQQWAAQTNNPTAPTQPMLPARRSDWRQ